MAGVVVSGVIFAIVRYFARAPPRTMTKEYQEATNEYMKVCHYMQSKPAASAAGIRLLQTLWREHGVEWRTHVFERHADSVPLQENNMEPITGVSSEGYVGKGQVQSPPEAIAGAQKPEE